MEGILTNKIDLTIPELRWPGSDLASEIWDLVKEPLMVPALRVAVYICLGMSIMLFVERLYMGIVIVLVKIFFGKPENRYKWEPIREDYEIGSAAFPCVLVQIPMFNEKEVYKISIGAACNLSWPSDRLVIQVLDDSTDPIIKDMVEKECERWESKGVNIRYQRRVSRGGYKAGALKEGLTHNYVNDCEYVAILDADFRPDPDFLLRSIPFLVHNPDLALVQARWRFANADECLLTRMQEMSLDYHFKVEQEVGSSTHAFFGFNGTGGIWRIAAIQEAGGWKDRTTVEDMDLAVRAGLKGWKFLYLGDLHVKSELPSTFKAFRFQQHRWSCGPANLFRKMFMEIIKNKATIIGLLEAKRANEWVVTEKLGEGINNTNKTNIVKAAAKKTKSTLFKDRILTQELGFAVFLCFCGVYDLMYGKNRYYIYLFLQALTFTIAGFSYIGTIVPS
ncbi:unnamed protein product [Cuscuta campestris]|uniref:glucomannan 4-beta-mannosyltransferase n=1 Tax=Cuscuta campestris TaxID=132261 RepID=A0A484N5G2_9ASTE|nr:unnamed protein product [Cuscuta campestris]